MVALVWEVIRIGGGPAQLSIVSTAGAIGVLLPALLGGVVADRVPQKRILLRSRRSSSPGCRSSRRCRCTDPPRSGSSPAVSLATGVGMAFYYPAYSAWLPSLVDEADLQAVNGFEGMVRPTLGQALGPGVAGVVVGAFSAGAAVSVAAVLALGGLLALTRVPLTPVRRDLTTDQPRPHARERALHRSRDGSGVGYVFGEVRAAVDAGKYEVGRAVLHDVGQRHHYGIGRRPADRIFPVSMLAEADGAAERQRVAGARLLFGGSDHPYVIGKLRRDGLEHRKPGGVDAVIIGEKDTHRGYPMRLCGNGTTT